MAAADNCENFDQSQLLPASKNLISGWWDSSPEAVVLVDPSNWSIVTANKRFDRKISRLSRVQNLNLLENLIHAEDKERFKTTMASVLERGVDYDFTPTIHDAKTLILGPNDEFPQYMKYDWVFMLQEPSPDEQGGLVVLSGRCVTIVKDHEKAAQNEFADFFNKAPIALHWLSGTGHVLWANETELNTLGYTAEEYIGQPIMKFCPDDEALVLEIFKTLGSGNTIHDVPVRFRTKNGQIKDLLIDSNVNWNADGSFGHTRCFIRDDTQRKVNEARQEAKAKAYAETVKQKDKYVAKIFHEIRTPCHLQLMTFQNIADTLPEEHPARALLDIASSQCVHIGALADDVRWAMLFQEGKSPKFTKQPFHLAGVLKDLENSVRALFGSKLNDVLLQVQVDPSVPENAASGYKEALVRILNHLLTNGMKFTSEGTVRLQVTYTQRSLENPEDPSNPVIEHGELTFKVSSTSPQIPEDAVHALWQRYWQGDALEESLKKDSKPSSDLVANATDGLGLGLNVAFNLVQLLGDQLNFQSDEQLTTFWFNMPVSYSREVDFYMDDTDDMDGELTEEFISDPLHQQTTTRTTSSNDRDSNSSKRDKSKSSSSSSKKKNKFLGCLAPWSSANRSTSELPIDPMKVSFHSPVTQWGDTMDTPQAKKHVAPDSKGPEQSLNPLVGLKAQSTGHLLVVDDNTICQTVLTVTLKQLKCTCDLAGNGKIACAMMEANPTIYDAIIMDLRMPVMDGIEATNHLRRNLFIDIPIIVLSAECDPKTMDEIKAAGANDFLFKPAKKDELVTLLRKHRVIGY